MIKKHNKIILASVGIVATVLVSLYFIPIDNNISGVVTKVEYVFPGILADPKARIELDDGSLITYGVSYHRWVNSTIYFNGEPLKSYLGKEVRLAYSSNIYGINYLEGIETL